MTTKEDIKKFLTKKSDLLKPKDGKQGEKGEPGSKGDAGSKGIKGPKGDKGSQGPKGEIGDPGEDALRITEIRLNKKKDMLVVFEDGKQFNLGPLPKGNKGEKGDKGKDGIDGINGKDGKTIIKKFISQGSYNAVLDPTVKAKGDILVYNGNQWVKLGAGADTEILTVDSTTATGLKWGEAATDQYQTITITRVSGLVSLITRADATTATVTRDGNNFITTIVDTFTSQTLTVARDGDNLISSITAT